MYGPLNVGSARLMPCVRIHFVAATSCTRSRSDNVCGAIGPGSRLVHIWRAAIYAGERALIVDAMSKPPPALGSGKFGTPCERMHEANLRPCRPGRTPLPWCELEEPEPAIATRQLPASRPNTSRR